MKKSGLILVAVIAAAVSFLTTAFMGSGNLSAAGPVMVSPGNIQDIENQITRVSDKAQKSVAFIKVTKTLRNNGQHYDPFWDMLRDFGFRQQNPQFNPKQEGLGTGFVIDDKEGYIVTNNHVIDGADKIEIMINKKNFKGKLIGTDPKTDVGLIKIEKFNKGDLEELRFADSDKLKVGQFAIAIGNPFGLSQSVSFGIVSAIGRSGMNVTEYEDFIQTDAAINPGNSGGPLININGEVIGMNTAIFSKSGGYMGIGFAVPSNMVKSITEQLKGGKVIKRAMMGVNIQDLSADLKKHLGIKENQEGVLISSVAKDSPAAKAGIKKGDVVIEFDGKQVDSAPKFKNIVGFSPFNKQLKAKIIRDNKEMELFVTLSDKFMFGPGDGDGEGSFANEDFGFSVNMAEGKIVVENVEQGSLAAMAGLMPGDIIEEANRKPAKSIGELSNIMRNAKSVLLLIERKGREFFVVINR